jgi:Na+/H+ antiporter NhaD/arsenite permease-like protein
MKTVIHRFKTDRILHITVILATLSFLLPGHRASISELIGWKVIVVMFTLMVAVSGIQETGFFDDVATRLVRRENRLRAIALTIVMTTFVLSMFLTNDAVLLTLVPFSMFIMRHGGVMRHAVTLIVLETIAANLGSALTPMGDPQNIHLFTFYGMSVGSFLSTTLPITLSGGVLLVILSVTLFPAQRISLEITPPQVSYGRVFSYALILGNGLLLVLGLVPLVWGLLSTLLLTVLYGRHLLRLVDWPLLLTFIAFFIASGNIASTPLVKETLHGLLVSDLSVMVAGISLSQVISNVPAAILLSSFVGPDQWKPLLEGVNIGAMGTLIASLASLISFRYVMRDMPDETGRYILTYSAISLLGILLVSFVVLLT